LRQMYHRLRNCFGCTGWYSCVTRLKWKHVLVHLETVLVSVQDRCTVCGKCSIASEIVLDTPDGTPR
jgi:Na+-translocating ferredoxin:NAD+ oxidoreductase RNF subunit RnfB